MDLVNNGFHPLKICRITCLDVWRTTVNMINGDILSLAKSPSFRRRMTYVYPLLDPFFFSSFRRFVACQQSLASTGGGLSILADDAKWQAVEQLSNDSIVGVRIGIARLAGSILGKILTLHACFPCLPALENVLRDTTAVPRRIFDVIDHLQHDSSPEVRSYIPNMAALQQGRTSFPSHSDSFLTFSRPPPLLHC